MAFEKTKPIEGPIIVGPLEGPFVFRMDKTFHRAQTFDEAEYMSVDTEGVYTHAEKLQICTYLNRIAFGYLRSGFPKFDKDVFEIRSFS